MAIGGYTYAILTCDIYPFQFDFISAAFVSIVMGALGGVLVGIPVLRLRGDYLAIVTLGFGEIIQSIIRNIEVVTKGTQGINPIPAPMILGYQISSEASLQWYYFFLVILIAVSIFVKKLENSALGRAWMSIREDELAARSIGVPAIRLKVLALTFGAGLSALAGVLWVLYLGSTGEPGNYDFQISVIALCILIVGGMGNVTGVVWGALIMMGFNSIVLGRFTRLLTELGLSSDLVFLSPSNWKYLIFGLALILVIRFKPEGVMPSSRILAELSHD